MVEEAAENWWSKARAGSNGTGKEMWGRLTQSAAGEAEEGISPLPERKRKVLLWRP